jgi:Fe-S-cluster-containing dehydrogenase component
MVIDVSLCHDCNNCFIACKDEHVDNDWLPYTGKQPRHGHRWIDVHSIERGQYPRIDVAYLPKPCQHCSDAPCAKAHPECVTRREDGVVMIDMAKAKGVKDLASSCPYGAIFWNEEANVAQKCTMCAHLLEGGEGIKMPRCAHSCPTGAITFHTMEAHDMERHVREEGLEVYLPHLGTKPSVYYKNLYRFERAFVAGGVLKDNECAEGVEVKLTGNGLSLSQITDYFGDFKFDALKPGEYTISVGDKVVSTLQVQNSVNVGSIEV